jgi:hypothetical protein
MFRRGPKTAPTPVASGRAIIGMGGTAKAGTPKGALGANDAVSRNYSATGPSRPFLGFTFDDLKNGRDK